MINPYRKIYCEIEFKCNNHCLNCSSSLGLLNSDKRISKAKLASIMEELARSAYDIIELSGGEPTLHPHFFELLEIIRRNFAGKVVLLTNAETSASKHFAKKVSNFVDDVVVTVYSHKASVHDEITRTEGSYERKLLGLHNLQDHGVKLHLKTLLMSPTFQDLAELTEFCIEEFGAGFHFNINALHIINEAWENREKIAVSYSAAAPYVQESFDVAEGCNLVTSAFAPMCLFDPVYWHHFPVGFGDLARKYVSISTDAHIGTPEVLFREFIKKPKKCDRCGIRDRCYWPWVDYIDFFGDQELAPFTEEAPR